jgi:hypothetical protein
VNATLVLRGLFPGSGDSRFGAAAVKIGTNAKLFADNPVILNVQGRFSAGGSSTVTPSQNQRLALGDFQINVTGPAAKVGAAATVKAYLRVPTGKIGVSPGGELEGRAIAARVSIGKHAQVIRAGVCGDGTLSVGEQCDVRVANGDAACPGKCVAGDPHGFGDIASGGPGQCRCSCTTDLQCSDSNACNGAEKCQNSICVPGDPPNCADTNPCAVSTCVRDKGCVQANVADGTPCPTAPNPCSARDVCVQGACSSGIATLCSDGNPCTADGCNVVGTPAQPSAMCTHGTLPNFTSCGPNGAVCFNGVCQ